MLAQAAANFIGVRFRLHGRNPATGLDCIGLLHASLTAIGKSPPSLSGYRLRNACIDEWLGLADRALLTPTKTARLPGDVMLITAGPEQHHLLIAENERTFIHAHAGLRRVVRQSLNISDNLLVQWRVTETLEDN